MDAIDQLKKLKYCPMKFEVKVPCSNNFVEKDLFPKNLTEKEPIGSMEAFNAYSAKVCTFDHLDDCQNVKLGHLDKP